MIYLGKIIEILRDLSDVGLQRREWVESQNSTVYFPSEMVSQLFDDTGLSDYLRIDRCPREISVELFQKFKELSQLTSKIDHLLPPEILLHSSEMEKVRKQAAVILDMLANNTTVINRD